MPDYNEAEDFIDPWIFTTLSTDPTLQGLVGNRISNTLSTSELAAPYVTFSVPSTRPVRGISGVILDTDSLVPVKAVSQSGSWTEAGAIAARIRFLLDKQGITVNPPTTPVPIDMASWWEFDERYPEVTEGVWYRHLVTTFRIRAVPL
jgi:hypothetical protein